MVRTRMEDSEDSTSARLDRMERMIMEMAETLRQQQQQQPQLQPPPPPVPPPVVQDYHAEDQTITLTKEFKKMKPPIFKGGIDPMKAEAWVLGVEKLFEVFPCTEAQKSMQDKKVTEFETLRQGNKTVAEYEAQFAKLARFAPHMVDTDYKKLPTYVDVLERAVMAEGNITAQNRISEWKGKRQNTQVSNGPTPPPNKKLNLGTSSASTPTRDSAPICSYCGKKHCGTCYRVIGACFRCSKTGHLVKDCPQRNQQNGNRATTSSARSTLAPNIKSAAKSTNNKDTARQGKVFALVPGDVQNAAAVVSGAFIVHGHFAHVLFDSGSTHSFVSKICVQNLDRSEELLPYVLCVSSPLGVSMVCTSVYFACELLIGEVRVYGNLLPLDMTHFDIILGMDWLSEYQATIDCMTKQISFHPPRQSKFTFKGHGVISPPYIISAMKACK
ncbi:uncharacterized protein LOC114282771 [Camellia sinensis]|uniref:uncharacterized protein LOC114282771 n=1 Tax=Camellia sinensis TaxID=4442 RepID=UPI0010362B55|nr:uncharacterized protein LOC114282771 [Camellia sinensis]